ncbi:MAG TPA: hypothetical protein PLA01_04665 [Acetivibrio sp.]|nr:hypothetical protein [Acetivibrio sp.]
MEMLFLKVLNMSITAGYVILAVLIVRLLLIRILYIKTVKSHWTTKPKMVLRRIVYTYINKIN